MAVTHAKAPFIVEMLERMLGASTGSLDRLHFVAALRAVSMNRPGAELHDISELDGQFFIVMEFVEGTTLRQLLGRGRPQLKKTLQIASQLADALAKAHEGGFVHCDLKPEHVMLTKEGHVKIVDFGLAKLADPAAVTSGTDRTIGDRTTTLPIRRTIHWIRSS